MDIPLEERGWKFKFNDVVNAERLDAQGIPQPEGMKLVDFVVEEHKQILLIEIKDPSQQGEADAARADFAKKMQGGELINQELTPKARDSYSYLHLMDRDSKPFLFVFLIGMEKLDKSLLIGFKDRLLKRIRCESQIPWKRLYIMDCIVIPADEWSKYFRNYSLSK